MSTIARFSSLTSPYALSTFTAPFTHRSTFLRPAVPNVHRPPLHRTVATASISPSSFAQQPAALPHERHSQYYQSLPPAVSSVYVTPLGHGCRHIHLNRPQALNAINLQMVNRLHSLLDALDLDKDVGVVLMSGMGGRAFCAGGDVVAVHDAGLLRKEAGGRTGEHELTKAFFKREYQLNWKLHHARFPLVAVLNGITMGGGVGLSAHLRYRAATPESLFAMPECAIGFFPDVGASFLLPRLFHPFLGHYLGLTGARLRGFDLVHAGIATHWVDNTEYPAHLELAYSTNGMMWAQAEDAVENVFWHLSAPSVDPPPPFSLTPDRLALIADVFSLPSVERIVEALDSRRASTAASSPLAPFIASTLHALSAASPLSLKVTLELLRRGALMPLERCLAMEYRVSQRMMMGEDFYSGVRSALITKDKKPKWAHARVEDVADVDVEAYFAPLTDQEELVLDYPRWQEPQWYI